MKARIYLLFTPSILYAILSVNCNQSNIKNELNDRIPIVPEITNPSTLDSSKNNQQKRKWEFQVYKNNAFLAFTEYELDEEFSLVAYESPFDLSTAVTILNKHTNKVEDAMYLHEYFFYADDSSIISFEVKDKYAPLITDSATAAKKQDGNVEYVCEKFKIREGHFGSPQTMSLVFNDKWFNTHEDWLKFIANAFIK